MIQKQDKVEESKSLVPESLDWPMATFRRNKKYPKISPQVPRILACDFL